MVAETSQPGRRFLAVNNVSRGRFCTWTSRLFTTYVYNKRNSSAIEDTSNQFVMRARAPACCFMPLEPVIVLSLRKTKDSQSQTCDCHCWVRDAWPTRAFLHFFPLPLYSRRDPLSLSSRRVVVIVVFIPLRFLDIDSCTLVAARDLMTRPLHTNLALSSTDIHYRFIQGIPDYSSLMTDNVQKNIKRNCT